MVFRIDEQNIYHRESLYGIYAVTFVISIIVCFASVIRSGKEYQTGMDGVLVLTLLMLFIGVGIQFIYSDIQRLFVYRNQQYALYNRCNKIVLQRVGPRMPDVAFEYAYYDASPVFSASRRFAQNRLTFFWVIRKSICQYSKKITLFPSCRNAKLKLENPARF